MAHDYNDGWEVEGPIIVNTLAFYQGTVPPYSLPFVNAPLNSVYVETNGTIWVKVGAGDAAVDWRPVLAAAPPLVTIDDIDYTVALGVSYVRYRLLTADRTITIPSASTERVLHLKVVENALDAYNLNIITPDSSLIEGETDALIQCEGTAVSLWANGTNWEVVAR